MRVTTNMAHAVSQPLTKPTDARNAVRYNLQARTTFRWEDSSGRSRELQGLTRDVSQKGAYLVAPECPPRGASVIMNIFLPPLAGETRLLSIEAQGRVLRTEKTAGGHMGFAVASDRVNLCGS